MVNIYAHLPDDIGAEKRLRDDLKNTYKGAFLAGFRYFRALRLQAPGIIFEFVLAALLTVSTLLFLFHDLNVSGLLPVLGFLLKFIFTVGLCFWIAGKLWRSIGLANRDRCRFVVGNFWILAVSTLIIVGTVLNFFRPEFGKGSESRPTQGLSSPGVEPPQLKANPAPKPSHVRPMAERVFVGQGWHILHNQNPDYETEIVKEANNRCAQLGDGWLLADDQDFEELEAELKHAGHVGSFWTATKQTNSNLDYFINADGYTEFRWANSGVEARRIVLCVFAVAI